MSFLKDLSAGTISGLFEGVGKLAGEIRGAITGEINADKKAEIMLKMQELESEIEKSRLSVMIAEASSQDKFTSRARPTMLYVVYILILFAVPMGFLHAIYPGTSENVITGFKLWLEAIPPRIIDLFEYVLLGYIAGRSTEKVVKMYKNGKNQLG